MKDKTIDPKKTLEKIKAPKIFKRTRFDGKIKGKISRKEIYNESWLDKENLAITKRFKSS
jgi:hypothetical protein